MDSWWKGPEYNGVKMLIVVVFAIGAGYFIYNGIQQNALENTGKIIRNGTNVSSSSGVLDVSMGLTGTGTGAGTSGAGTTGTGSGAGTTGTGAGTTGTGTGTTTTGTGSTGLNAGGTTKGGTTGIDPVCDRTSTAPIVLTVTSSGPTTPTSVVTSTGGVTGGQWLNFSLTNPDQCPVKLTKMQFKLTTNLTGSWPAIQNISVIDTTTGLQFGPTLHPELTPTPLAPMTFIDTTGIVIYPFATESFTLTSDSKNVPSENAATGIQTRFRLQLTEFLSTNTITSVISNQTFPATIPPFITPIIYVYP